VHRANLNAISGEATHFANQLGVPKQIQPQRNNSFGNKILPKTFTHYMFDPTDGAILRRENTKLYAKKRNFPSVVSSLVNIIVMSRPNMAPSVG
jgi:hypothetical protein